MQHKLCEQIEIARFMRENFDSLLRLDSFRENDHRALSDAVDELKNALNNYHDIILKMLLDRITKEEVLERLAIE